MNVYRILSHVIKSTLNYEVYNEAKTGLNGEFQLFFNETDSCIRFCILVGLIYITLGLLA